MSFSLAWVAVNGVEPEEFLDAAGFEDTGEIDEYAEHDHSGGYLQDEWYCLLTNDFSVLEAAKLAKWSAGARIIAAAVDEESMTSLAMEWLNGKEVWSISYEAGEGEGTLAVQGQLPELFDELRKEAEALQAKADAADEDVDYVFDIPLDVAAHFTGFRHDQMGFDDDIPPFTVLERVHVV